MLTFLTPQAWAPMLSGSEWLCKVLKGGRQGPAIRAWPAQPNSGLGQQAGWPAGPAAKPASWPTCQAGQLAA